MFGVCNVSDELLRLDKRLHYAASKRGTVFDLSPPTRFRARFSSKLQTVLEPGTPGGYDANWLGDNGGYALIEINVH